MPCDPSRPVVEARGLSKAYALFDRPQDRVRAALFPGRADPGKLVRALDGVDLEVRRGETVGVIGRNGSGKSTLLRVLAGVTGPTAGNLGVRGRVGALLDLGAGFDPELTGLENVRSLGVLRGRSRREVERSIAPILAFADIGEHAHRPVKTYSGGTFARLAFAEAVHDRPDLMLVDEVLSVGDVFFQQKCHAHLRDTLKDCAKVFVTHDLHALAALADRAVLLEAGRVAFQGDPAEAARRYTGLWQGRPDPVADAPEADSGPERLAPVPGDRLTGRGEAVIEAAGLRIGGEWGRQSVKPGEACLARLRLRTTVPGSSYFFGYMLVDRFGTHLFGETSFQATGGDTRFEAPGLYRVDMAFVWPKVLPGDYTLTLGVGQGTPHSQTVQCWAHGVAAVTALNPDTTLCLMDHGLTRFEAAPWAGP